MRCYLKLLRVLSTVLHGPAIIWHLLCMHLHAVFLLGYYHAAVLLAIDMQGAFCHYIYAGGGHSYAG